MKIERTLINLKAGIPFSIRPQGGIDCYKTQFTFEYGASVHGKNISLAFRTTHNLVSRNIVLKDEGYQTFVYDGELGAAPDSNFDFIEITCAHDIALGISAKEQEVVWL